MYSAYSMQECTTRNEIGASGEKIPVLDREERAKPAIPKQLST
jgi:hypothetical protein